MSYCHGCGAEGMTDFAETFRYMDEGVKNSDEIEAHSGTRFGGLGSLIAS